MYSEQKQPVQNRVPPRMHSANNPQQGGGSGGGGRFNNSQNRGQSSQTGTQQKWNSNNNTGNQQSFQGNQMNRQPNFNRNQAGAGNNNNSQQQGGNYRKPQGQGQQQQFQQQGNGFQPYKNQQQQQQLQGNNRSRSPIQRNQQQQQQFGNQSYQGKNQQQQQQYKQQDGVKSWNQTAGNNRQFAQKKPQFQEYQKPIQRQKQQQFEEEDMQDNNDSDNQDVQNDIVDDKRPARVLQVKRGGQIGNSQQGKQLQVKNRIGKQVEEAEEEDEEDDYSEERDEGVDDDDDDAQDVVDDKRPPRVLQVKKNGKGGATPQANITDEDDRDEENESNDQDNNNNQDGSEQEDYDEENNSNNSDRQDGDEDQSIDERDDDDDHDDAEGYDDEDNQSGDHDQDEENDGYAKTQQDFKSSSQLHTSGQQLSQEMRDQEKKLSEMCHETVNDAQFNEHMARGMKAFAFFERNSQGYPVKSKAMKVYYRSAAGNELETNNILSPIAINKSATRMLNQILDYFLDPRVKVKELVVALLDRLRNLSTEFEPLSKHLSLFEGTKLMIEPKEKVLMVHLVGLNFFRRDSCLKDSSLENGYSEKKHFEALQTLVDSLYNSYENNVDKVIRVIKSSPNEPAESLKAKILANNQLYLSPLIPKVIAWRLLITFDEPKSLHRMDRFLTDTLDILDNDAVFAAVFDMITALVRKNYFKYFDQLQHDARLDYISANAALLHLTSVRLHSAQQDKKATYPQTLEKLHFDINDQADRDSADQFLERLGSSLQELEVQKEARLDFSMADNLGLKQRYWPNFFKGIEWRKPESFSSAVKKMVSEAEQNDFPGQLIDYLIAKERGLAVSRVPPLSTKVPQIVKPVTVAVEYKKPSLNLTVKTQKQKTLEELKAQEEAARIAEEKRLQEIAERAAQNEAQKQQRIANAWKKTAIDLERNQISQQVLAGLVDYKQKEFADSFMLLKHFLKWKRNVKAIQRYKDMILYLDKFRNPQKIYYGLNNIPIELTSNKAKDLFEEAKANNFEDILRVIEERDQLKLGPKQDFLDKLALSFLKDKQAQKYSHVYYKITIIGDEQNPLIADMVGSLAKYLSQGKMGIDETTFQITVNIDDISIEYTLQLQMAKYLHCISSKDLSGSDLLIYVLDENDNEQNQNYFKTFKNHLRALLHPNIAALGQNVLFLSVSDMLPRNNKSAMDGMSRQASNSFSAQQNQTSNSNKNLMHSSISSNSNQSPFNFGKRTNSGLQRTHSQSDKQIGGFLGNNSHNNNTHLLNYSNSVQIEQLMLYEMNYTNVESQDSEGLVRKAIRYLHSNLKLRELISQGTSGIEEDSNAVIQSYHVMAYRYETIDLKCINKEPFSDRMFKGGIDAAVEKSIKVKIPFEALRLTSAAKQFKEIAEVLRGHKDQHERKHKNSLETRKTTKQFKLEQKQHKSANINDHHNPAAGAGDKNRNVDTIEQSDMKEFFVFKEIFNSCIFQLIQNALGIVESSHLVPFDQLTNHEKDTMLMLEENKEYLGKVFDRLFLRGYLQRLKHSITTTLTTQYSYHQITYLLVHYYRQILEINPNELAQASVPGQAVSLNISAYSQLIAEMDETAKDNFNFDNCAEAGIVGNWSNVFIKLAEQLSEIFSEENDIPIFVGNTFAFRLDEKKINKQASRETHGIGHWLVQLKRDTHKYLSSSSYSAAPGLLKKRKRHSHIGNEEDYDNAVRIYKEIVSFNENNYGYDKEENGNSAELAEMKDKNSNSVSNSSDIEVEEEDNEVLANNQQTLMKKRRTACLVLNSAEDALCNDKYQQKIERLMRGEITASPTRLNEDFV